MDFENSCVAPRSGILAHLDIARSRLGDASLALRGALAEEWVSVAAEAYRTRLDDRAAALRAFDAALDALEGIVRRAELAHANLPGA